MTLPSSTTPLSNWHLDAGAKMSPFAGYDMPLHYGSIVKEHLACRSSAALFDVSHMGRIRFDGERAPELLDHLLSRRVSDMQPGQVRYGLVCNTEGGVLDDVLVYYVETPSGGRYHLLVVNASNRQKIIKWLEPHLADYPEVICTDRTEITSMIAIQGPQALALSEQLFKRSPNKLKYYHCLVTEQFQKPVLVSRTGYTGEDGLELITRAEEANRIWENLILAGRKHDLVPAGLGARDTLRLEAAMPLYGHELNEEIDPITAGLSFACNLKDRNFIGSEALREIKSAGPKQTRVGLRPEGRRPARQGSVILQGSTEIGTVTSGTSSPTMGVPIAMAYVAAESSDIGTHVEIDIRGQRVAAEIVPLPFYRRST